MTALYPIERESEMAWVARLDISIRTVDTPDGVFGDCEYCDDVDCRATVRVYGTPRASIDHPITLLHVGGGRCAEAVIEQAVAESVNDRDIVVEVAC